MTTGSGEAEPCRQSTEGVSGHLGEPAGEEFPAAFDEFSDGVCISAVSRISLLSVLCVLSAAFWPLHNYRSHITPVLTPPDGVNN